MYKCAKTLMYLAFVIVIPALLSACGGEPTEDTPSQPSGIANSLEASSNSTPSSARSSSVSQDAQLQSSAGIESADIEKAPATVQLQLYRLSESSITLVWDEAAGIGYYEISRDGEFIARVDSPSYSLVDEGLTPNTNYNYAIIAFDLTGKESGSSQTFSMRTLAANSDASPKSSISAQANSSVAYIGASPSLTPKSSSDAESSISSKSVSSTKSSTSSKSSISSKPSSSKSSSSSKSTSSRLSSASSKSSASSVGQQPVTISWNHPSQRENGVFLELDEIGGYQIRYRKPTDTSYTYVTVNGNTTTAYTSVEQAQELEFEIAVFDTNGLYSQFVKVSR